MRACVCARVRVLKCVRVCLCVCVWLSGKVEPDVELMSEVSSSAGPHSEVLYPKCNETLFTVLQIK